MERCDRSPGAACAKWTPSKSTPFTACGIGCSPPGRRCTPGAPGIAAGAARKFADGTRLAPGDYIIGTLHYTPVPVMVVP